MTKDPFERYNTEPEYFLKGENEPASLQRIDARIESARRGDPKVPLLRWLTIGAAAILLAVLINDIAKQPEAPAMADRFFEPLPNYVTLQTRSSETADNEVYELYEKEEYSLFIRSLQRSNDLDPLDSLYLGISYAATGDWEMAQATFASISYSLPEEYRPSRDWYLGLSLCAAGQVDEASELLEKISAGKSSYANRASELQEALR